MRKINARHISPCCKPPAAISETFQHSRFRPVSFEASVEPLTNCTLFDQSFQSFQKTSAEETLLLPDIIDIARHAQMSSDTALLETTAALAALRALLVASAERSCPQAPSARLQSSVDSTGEAEVGEAARCKWEGCLAWYNHAMGASNHVLATAAHCVPAAASGTASPGNPAAVPSKLRVDEYMVEARLRQVTLQAHKQQEAKNAKLESPI